MKYATSYHASKKKQARKLFRRIGKRLMGAAPIKYSYKGWFVDNN